MRLDGLVLCLFGSGCFISIGSGNAPAPPKCPSPGAVAVDVCAVDPREYTVTIDEINAAMQLSFDNMCADQLKKIAVRRGLTPAEQEYVACNALNRLGFDNMKVDVLKVLIDNPDFSYRRQGKDPAAPQRDRVRQHAGRGLTRDGRQG